MSINHHGHGPSHSHSHHHSGPTHSHTHHQDSNGETQWAEFSQKYDGWLAAIESNKQAFRGINEVACEVGLDLSGLDILEVGCGTGLLTSNLAPKAKTYTAIDTSPSMLKVLNSKSLPMTLSGSKPITALFSISSTAMTDILTSQLSSPTADNPSRTLTLPLGQFDLIVGNTMIHHISKELMDDFLRGVKSLLVPGTGRVIWTDMLLEGQAVVGGNENDSEGKHSHDFFDEKSLHKVLVDAGFEEVDVQLRGTTAKPLDFDVGRWEPTPMLVGTGIRGRD